jgi:SulP family sulfate permease
VISGQAPVYGLYCNLIGPVLYTIFGTGVHTIVGALALMAIMVSNVARSVDPTAVPGTDRFNHLTVMVIIIMGTMRIAMGVLRFGFIADFISIPVLSSFVTGAGTICSSFLSRSLATLTTSTSTNDNVVLFLSLSLSLCVCFVGWFQVW